jgi:hypothetical protein
MKMWVPTLLSLAFLNLNICSQDTLVMPITGNGGIFNTCYTVIYDNGGPDSNYHNYSNSTITIAPLWVQHVNLYFEDFNTEDFFDSLSIYDGPGTTFPLIGTFSGNSLQGQTISSTGNSITLKFRSDDIQTGSGFKAIVGCLMGNENNISNLTSIYPNPAQNNFSIAGIKMEAIKDLKIFDVAGRYISNINNFENVNIENLPRGIYFLYIEDKNDVNRYIRFIKE